jgi:hypothetical protein
MGFCKMQYRENDLAFGNDAESGGKGDAKTEEEGKEEGALIKVENIQA